MDLPVGKPGQDNKDTWIISATAAQRVHLSRYRYVLIFSLWSIHGTSCVDLRPGDPHLFSPYEPGTRRRAFVERHKTSNLPHCARQVVPPPSGPEEAATPCGRRPPRGRSVPPCPRRARSKSCSSVSIGQRSSRGRPKEPEARRQELVRMLK